jgi:ABC-2 type transport system ATP-binding protein
MEGFRSRSAGSVSVLGHDPADGDRSFKARIGIVLQETGIDPYLTVAETIDQYRDVFPQPRKRDEIIEVVGLEDKTHARVSKLSGGQKRRLDVAIGLAGDPELLFLDEPTTGFDPTARRNAWQMVKNLQVLGKTVFLTTHYMDEAQFLADRVAIIANGEIVAQGPPGTLTAAEGGTIVTFRLPSGAPELPERLNADATVMDGIIRLSPAEPMRVLNELTGWALEHGIELEQLSVFRPSLEDVYLQLTSEGHKQ